MNGFAVRSYGSVQDRQITYADGVKALGSRPKRKLGNNTYLVRVDDETLGVKLHETIVVYIFKSGIYQYDTGRWRTVTTKSRINQYGPVKVHQANNIWYIGDGVFEDGVRIDSDGKVLTKLRVPDAVQRQKRKLDKLTLAYIKGFCEHVKENGLKIGDIPKDEPQWKVGALDKKAGPLEPTSGDCWACYFGLSHDSVLKEPMGVDHLLQHFEESYYVPSLLWKAILTTGYTNPSFIWQSIAADARRGDTRFLGRVLTGYFRKRKPALLELMG